MAAFGRDKEDRRKHPATTADSGSEVASEVGATPKNDETDRAGAWDEARLHKYLPFYQRAIIAVASSDPQRVGRLKKADILSGKIFTDSNLYAANRLPAKDEKVFLPRVMKYLEEKKICFLQGEYFVFPDCWPRDLPEVPWQLPIIIGYGFKGDCRTVYVTLIADLVSGTSFSFERLWRDAADFIPLIKKGRMRVQLKIDDQEQGQLLICFDKDVNLGAQSALVMHIRDHLWKFDADYFTAQWNYACPKCDVVKPGNATLTNKIMQFGVDAQIRCAGCDHVFRLWSELHEEFAEAHLLERVNQLLKMGDSPKPKDVAPLRTNAPAAACEPTPALRTLRVFLAASEELRGDRDQLELHFLRENDDLRARGIGLQFVHWETLPCAISPTRSMNEYIKALEGCDVFVVMFYSKVGKYSLEEFDAAYNQFKVRGKPLVYTYFKDGILNTQTREQRVGVRSLIDFKDKLDEMGHYPTVYDGISDLKWQFLKQVKQW